MILLTLRCTKGLPSLLWRAGGRLHPARWTTYRLSFHLLLELFIADDLFLPCPLP